MTSPPTRRIVAAVCTFRRPTLLGGLLDSLADQEVPAGVGFSVTVVDNDAAGSAREVAEAPRAVPVDYVVEPDPGIPLARQRSVDETAGADAIIFVDDDETCPPGWLRALVECWDASGADVVTGPVRGILPEGAPGWAHHSDVHTSVGRHPDGAQVTIAYTNNTLVSRRVLDAVTPAFDPAFRYTGGSDAHLFQRVHRAGFTIVWCEAAQVTEDVPPQRTSLAWLTRRGFRTGAADAHSRLRITPGWRTRSTILLRAAAKVASGLVWLVRGALGRRADYTTLGWRRAVSGVGAVAGLLGIQHQEYRAVRTGEPGATR